MSDAGAATATIPRAADAARRRRAFGRLATRNRLAVVGFPIYTRLVRGVVLSLREREFVEAARALGASDAVILGRHVLPHLLSPVIVAFSLDVGAKILATAGLSFLGLGTQPPTADW